MHSVSVHRTPSILNFDPYTLILAKRPRSDTEAISVLLNKVLCIFVNNGLDSLIEQHTRQSFRQLSAFHYHKVLFIPLLSCLLLQNYKKFLFCTFLSSLSLKISRTALGTPTEQILHCIKITVDFSGLILQNFGLPNHCFINYLASLGRLLVRRWLQLCLEKHSHECRPPRWSHL